MKAEVKFALKTKQTAKGNLPNQSFSSGRSGWRQLETSRGGRGRLAFISMAGSLSRKEIIEMCI